MDIFPLGNYDANCNGIQNTEVQGIQVDLNSFNRDFFMESIKAIDTMGESELIMLIKNHIDVIVDKTLSDEKSMGSILCNPKFVSAYNKAMKMIPIDHERRLFVNKLTYEYSILDNPDQTILNQFKEVSKYVNKDITNNLVAKAGFNRHIANDLVTCRYSSRHENTNVQRLNFCMCKYNAEIFTEQTIIFVYEQLFDRVSELFTSSMLEVYSKRELDDLGGEFEDVYGNISLAILTILNNMPSLAIRQVILIYIDAYNEWYSKRYTLPRFTLRALSQDYARIVSIVDKLIEEGIEVP